MLKKILTGLILMLLLSVAIVQAMENHREKKAEGVEPGNIAPDFTLSTLDGKTVSLSDYKGKKVLLNFWATWCPPCKKEIPEMKEYAERMPDNEVILAVNMDPKADVKGFAAKMGMNFPVLLDKEDKVNSAYKVISIPTTYFIDSNGHISHKIIGQMKAEDLTEQMKKME
ncbi:peroxiredoxin family protein [Peribacillus sp. SCS-37]|uniref:peroxiredoxin family protein n=1 Tax=Paraperibacillus esterisolvens TaxID=3115296 RepID=UPI003905C8F6